MTHRSLIAPFLALVLLGGAAASERAPLRLEVLAEGLVLPLYATAPPGDMERIFILEKTTGRVRIARDGALLATPFVNIGGQISIVSEQGLLGMAFHPDFENNRVFFLSYTRTDGASVVSRWQADAANPDLAVADSEQVFLTIPQPRTNHNGGMIEFGPDGYLYVSLGDGGGGGDQFGNGQNLGTVLGTLLRLDADTPGPQTPYSIPPDNPFVGMEGADPRIWAYGLRNPWRFSFDRLTGDLFIADVGQNLIEEINFQFAASPGGENYGWPVFEGDRCFQNHALCASPELFEPPVLTYGRDFGASITGGYVYRGGRIPWLRGAYLYADFSSGRVAAFRLDGPAVTDWEEYTAELNDGLSPALGTISSFGEDDRGEVLLVEYNRGRVSRIAPDTIAADVTASGAVDAVDVQFVINAALGLDTGGLYTDLNDDGAVNAVDVQLVINAALGIGIDNARKEHDRIGNSADRQPL